MGQVERMSPWSVPAPPLGILHLLANFVTQDLIPVDLSACDRQLTTQGLKSGVRHGLVVLTDCSLRAKHGRKQASNILFVHFKMFLYECFN